VLRILFKCKNKQKQHVLLISTLSLSYTNTEWVREITATRNKTLQRINSSRSELFFINVLNQYRD